MNLFKAGARFLPALVLSLAACGGAAAPASSPAAASSSSASAKPAASAAAASTKPALSGAASTAASAAVSAKPASSGVPAASASASPAAFTAFNPSAPGDKMIVSHSQLASTPNEAALAAGIFAKHNLNVDLRYIPQGATGMQVLLSGESNVGELGGAEMLAAAAGGADVLIIANLEPVYPFKFMVSKDIQNASDLKGKKIGITTVGSVDDAAIRAALPSVNLDPAKDVTFVPIGPEPARVAALLNGQIQGTDATPAAVIQLQAGGARMLFDIAALNLHAATAALAAQRSWVNGHKDVTQRYIDSIVEAIAWERKNKAQEQDVMRKVFKIDDQTTLDAVYDYYVLHTTTPQPLPKLEDFKATADEVAKLNPKVKDLDITKVLDASFVQSALDRGLDK